MQGFYQNLLTKNVAMGGDVEGSAVSAYTAGSKRHTQINSSSGSGESINKEKQQSSAESKVDNEGASDKETEKNKRKHESVTTTHSENRGNVALKVLRTEDKEDTNLSELLPSEPIPTKEEMVSSARQRFLDRKLASSSTS
jgi:predicted phosphatase